MGLYLFDNQAINKIFSVSSASASCNPTHVYKLMKMQEDSESSQSSQPCFYWCLNTRYTLIQLLGNHNWKLHRKRILSLSVVNNTDFSDLTFPLFCSWGLFWCRYACLTKKERSCSDIWVDNGAAIEHVIFETLVLSPSFSLSVSAVMSDTTAGA